MIESKDVENDLARKIKSIPTCNCMKRGMCRLTSTVSRKFRTIENEFQSYDSIFISPSIPEPLRNRFISLAVTLKRNLYPAGFVQY